MFSPENAFVKCGNRDAWLAGSSDYRGDAARENHFQRSQARTELDRRSPLGQDQVKQWELLHLQDRNLEKVALKA